MLYFGELGLFRFDERVGQAYARRASHFALPERELPGSPTLVASGNEARKVGPEARDFVQLFARPSDEAELGLDSGRLFSTYFKLALGLESRSGKLAWVHTHPTEIIAGAAFAGGIALCDVDGQVSFLGAKTGAPTGSVSLGQKVESCLVQADGLNKPAAPAPAKPLEAQIADAMDVKESEMVAVQKVLLRDLSTLEPAQATKVLIDLASDPRTSPALIEDVRRALAARKSGAEYMIDALGRHYDFLKDVLSPPPVGPMADALAAMKETRAAQALAAHLADPANGSEDVKRVAAALAQIGTRQQLPQLKSFFALNRSIAEDENIAQAVVSAAKALVKLAGPEGKDLVSAAANDPMTVSQIRQGLLALAAEGDKGEKQEKGEKHN